VGYNTKNHMEQGGEKWTIGGTLEVLPGASVTGLSADPLLPAAANALGGIKAAEKTKTDTVPAKIGEDNILYVPAYPEIPVAENQAESTAEDAGGLAADFNLLLAKLKAAGIMAKDGE